MRPLGSPRPGGAGVPRGSAIKGPGTAVPGVAVAVTAAGFALMYVLHLQGHITSVGAAMVLYFRPTA